MIIRNPFDELSVFELANNHRRQLDRGLKIVSDFSKAVRFNNVRTAIKAYAPVRIDAIECPYAHSDQLKQFIYQRGF